MDAQRLTRLKEVSKPFHFLSAECAEDLADYLLENLPLSNKRLVVTKGNDLAFCIGYRLTFNYCIVRQDEDSRIVMYSFNVRATKGFVTQVSKVLNSLGFRLVTPY